MANKMLPCVHKPWHISWSNENLPPLYLHPSHHHTRTPLSLTSKNHCSRPSTTTSMNLEQLQIVPSRTNQICKFVNAREPTRATSVHHHASNSHSSIWNRHHSTSIDGALFTSPLHLNHELRLPPGEEDETSLATTSTNLHMNLRSQFAHPHTLLENAKAY